MSDVASLIKRVSRGKHGSEDLSQTEAQRVFSALLKPDADMLQVGAFLIAQRMKGETAAELAGFVRAAREHIAHFDVIKAPARAVDLPCYAGKRRAAHAHLIAALQARDKGIPIFVHGVEHISGRVSAWQVLKQAGVQSATNLVEANKVMQHDGIVYVDLEELCPDLHRIYHLRDRLGVRSFANTVARLLNPMQCEGQLNGLFHTPYADYMTRANILLGQTRSLIFMGAEGEPELYADRQKLVNQQEGETMKPLTCMDSGNPPYPKQVVTDLKQIYADFQQMLVHQPDAREQATINKMLSGFMWASGTKGITPCADSE